MAEQQYQLRNERILSEGLLQHIINVSGTRVQSGPFAGMDLCLESTWSLDLPSRLLGTYEMELHDLLLRGKAAGYDVVVDVGCADGFYAVGLAMLYPYAKVFAYDTNDAAQELTRRNAELNNVAERVRIGGTCDSAELARLAQTGARMLVICDCEGYEMELFNDKETISALRSADVVVECHNFVNPQCTKMICGFFEGSHHLQHIQAGARNPNVFAALSGIGESDRWLAVCEYRPCAMNWLFCKPRI